MMGDNCSIHSLWDYLHRRASSKSRTRRSKASEAYGQCKAFDFFFFNFFLLKHLYNDHLPLSQKLSPVTSALREIFILKCTVKEKIFTGNLQWGTRAPQCSSGRWAYDAFVQFLNLPLSFKKACDFFLTWFCYLLKKAKLTRSMEGE